MDKMIIFFKNLSLLIVVQQISHKAPLEIKLIDVIVILGASRD